MRRDQNLPVPRRNPEQGLLPLGGGSLFDPSTFLGASPWQMMRRMQEDMDRLFSQVFTGALTPALAAAPQQMWSPGVYISEDDREWRVEADLPGVQQDNLDIQVRDNALILRAQMRQEQEQPQEGQAQNGNEQQGKQGQQRQYYQRERRYGFFERVLPLPESVDEENIRAKFRDGVLAVHLPKAQQAASPGRRIPIGSGQQSPPTAGQEVTAASAAGSRAQGGQEQGQTAQQTPEAAPSGAKGGSRRARKSAQP